MVSTYANYSLVTRNLQQTLTRISQQAEVSREAAYYKANIDKVKTVDDLLKDHRLYSYAVKAYGLEDMGYAKALMRKVLESDLSDANSYANKLSDKRYREFAASFSFTTGTDSVAQSTVQTDSTIGLYTAVVKRGEDAISERTGYYNYTIGNIRNVDALLADDKMRSYVFDAFGIDDNRWSRDTIRGVLTSDLADPTSYINTVWVSQKSGINANIAKAEAEGTDANQKIESYLTQLKQPGADGNDLRAKIELERRRLLTTAGQIISYQDSLATIANYEKMAAAFEFSADGSLPAGTNAQTDAERIAINSSFVNSQGAAYIAADDDNIAMMSRLYTAGIANVKTVDAFIKTPNVYNFALKSVGLDPNEVSPSIIREVLKSDPNDPKSYVNRLRDERYVTLAKAFNFDSKGNLMTPLVAQEKNEVTQVMKDYIIAKTRFATEAEKPALRKQAEKDAVYYQNTILKIDSVTELLADRKLLDIALTSRGLDPADVSNDFLKKLFTSNLDDPKSFANTESDPRFKSLVTSFNFDDAGKVVRVARFGPQTSDQLAETQQRFLQQTLEIQQGDRNPGVRLAIYFQRKVPSITSAYDILADKALAEVFRTTFGLPDSIGTMDVDRQAKLVTKYLNLEDLADAGKLAKLLNRFTAMYDMKNSEAPSSSALTILRGGVV